MFLEEANYGFVDSCCPAKVAQSHVYSLLYDKKFAKKNLIIGDIINLLSYKMRPYELELGAVDRAIEECKVLISNGFLEKKNLVKTTWKCRKILEKIKLDRLQPKAKVMVMGEFWAAMTEGDGNYNLHRFLESEGAECIPQSIVNRLMLSIWEAERVLAANFLSVETSGEGAANFYSRVQMALFKAKQSAKEEFEQLAIPKDIPDKVHNYLYQPRNNNAGSAAKLIMSL